jgi:hypothetical protein
MTTDTTQPKPGKIPSKTKAWIVARLLVREKGATLDEIEKATGWQAHSCRAFLTGLRKKGSDLVREDRGGGKTAYRMSAPTARAEPEACTLSEAADA